MEWITAPDLDRWADHIDARIRLSEIISRLVRASAANISSFRFPTGDSAQAPGYDGRLTAVPAASFERFLPEGDSVWEFGTATDHHDKANSDFTTRTKDPKDVDPANSTFVFVTPRKWDAAPGWAAEKKKLGIWKDVRVIDGVGLEEWLKHAPAVAASVAREIVGSLPIANVYSPEEFWNEYAPQFQRGLTEEVVLAGRQKQREDIINFLLAGGQIARWQGDSLAEVVAFVVATIRKAEADVRKFLEARVLVVETKDAARRLAGMRNLIFIVRGEAVEMAGMLAATGPVIVPVGRDSMGTADVTRLRRASGSEMSESLQTMGYVEEEAHRFARECDRSVTILARRIPSATAKLPTWHANADLLPALLAGAWHTNSDSDRQVIATLAGTDYEAYESRIRPYLVIEDSPIERQGSVWAVRAPVDVFSFLAPLIGIEHLKALREVCSQVLGEFNPALALPASERPFAQLRGATLKHSYWLRDGLATTLLIIAAMGERAGLQVASTSPQRFVNEIVAEIPSLREDQRVMASLSQQLPLLMEAAPDPLLGALEHLLEGDGEKIKGVFQDSDHDTWFGMSSPHTGLLWALELLAWDPAYLSRAVSTLTRLSRVDPGGKLTNRSANSLAHIFLPWHPQTNAIFDQRLAELRNVVAQDQDVGWKLLERLLPRGHDIGHSSQQPRFREAGASNREVLTRGVVWKTYEEVIQLAVATAGTIPSRWADILNLLHAFPEPERDAALRVLDEAAKAASDQEKEALWENITAVVRHHEAYPGAEWSLSEQQLLALKKIAGGLQPKDPVKTALWLFTERLPEIKFESGDQLFQETETHRRQVVGRVFNERGLEGVLSIAGAAEAPRYVGFAFGQVVPDVATGLGGVLAALGRGPKLSDFAAWLSAAMRNRFGEAWAAVLGENVRSGKLGRPELVALVVTWPHDRQTWGFVDSLGNEFSRAYWQAKPAWGLDAQGEEFDTAVRRYLDVDRAEFVVDALWPKAKDLSTSRILEVVDQFERRLVARPEILHNSTIAYDVQRIFAELQTRSDLELTDVAVREYKFLPLLRDVPGVREEAPLAIDRYMGESPEFFVQVLCDIFRPAAQRKQEAPPPNQEQQTRARWAWKLLDGFTHIPGSDGDRIDAEKLRSWVSEVCRLAADADRLAVAEQRIGAVLAHSSTDPGDDLWPHRAVRDCLESQKSREVERGLQIEQFNMRGVTARDPRAGGEPERKLAADWREKATHVKRWPRTHQLLLNIANSWEEAAKREDLEARQDEMREF
jgi:hypothetical protein